MARYSGYAMKTHKSTPPVTHRIPGLVLTDHTFRLPLDYAQLDGPTIDVFAREVVAPTKASEQLPWLVFFQGGPGSPAPRPKANSGWLKQALNDYRVLLLDQRGTGRSTPLTFQTLARFETPQAQADYLRHFRADAIVHDAEAIRRALLGEDEPWSVLGQSYGGFCITTYLSFAPAGLREAMLTGGIPPVTRNVDEVYRATYQTVARKNRQYYERYPADVELAQDIVTFLCQNEVRLPGGDRLSPRRFQQLGLAFGMSDGFEQIHYLLEEAFVEGRSGRELSYVFLRHFEENLAFETNPIFAVLHEAIYCQQAPSNWSAERIRAEYPAFEATSGNPVYFTGEMIYPWMFEEYQYLRPLQEAAEILAAYEDWLPLYDLPTLQANTVPAAAAIYYHDMYVERIFSTETADLIPGLNYWITNEYEHNGLRADGEKILSRLQGMLRGEVI